MGESCGLYSANCKNLIMTIGGGELQHENKKTANYYGLDYIVYSDGRIEGPERGFLKQRKNQDGYMEVTLGTTENRHARVKVHRIIAEQFVPNPLGLPEVNHLDCNRSNNNADNLEWCTHQENVRYSADKGHYKCKTGELNGRAKLTWDIVRSIRNEYSVGKRISEISKENYIPYSTVLSIVHNKTWVQ